MATPTLRPPYGVSSPYTVDDPGVLKNPFGLGTGGGGGTGPSGHGSTTTTAAPTLVSGNWRFTVADTTAFNAFGLPIYCGDGTNSIYGTVVNVISPTQITVAPTTTTGTVTSIANGSTFTFSGVQGPAGGGGGGAMTKIAQVVTTAGQTTATFSSIPSTYSALRIIICAADTSTSLASQGFSMQCNADNNSAHYVASYIQTAGGVAPTAGNAGYSNGISVANIPGRYNNANAVGTADILIPNYAQTTFYKSIQSLWASYNALATNPFSGTVAATFLSSAAITRLDFLVRGTAFVPGSTLTLYGIP